ADAIIVGIEEGFDVQLVDDRVLVPARVMKKYRSPVLARHCSPLRPWAVYAIFRTADARARYASTGSSVPLPGMAVHQILPLGDRLVGQPELPERQLEMAL